MSREIMGEEEEQIEGCYDSLENAEANRGVKRPKDSDWFCYFIIIRGGEIDRERGTALLYSLPKEKNKK